MKKLYTYTLVAIFFTVLFNNNITSKEYGLNKSSTEATKLVAKSNSDTLDQSIQWGIEKINRGPKKLKNNLLITDPIKSGQGIPSGLEEINKGPKQFKNNLLITDPIKSGQSMPFGIEEINKKNKPSENNLLITDPIKSGQGIPFGIEEINKENKPSKNNLLKIDPDKSGQGGPQGKEPFLLNEKKVSENSATQGTLLAYNIYDNYWGDAVDMDGDGYTRYRKLYTDVDVDDGSTRSIYLKIWRRPASSATYTLYFTTPNYSITGASGNDWIWVAVGSPNPELNHDTYYFTVQVFEAGGTTVKDEATKDTDADLNNELFETIVQDPAGPVYSIWDNYWADAVDIDGDGYNRYRKLYTDVDVNDGSTRSIYLKIWVKPASSGTYTLYFTTPNFSITGATGNDWIWVAVGSPNTQLNQDSYDFYVQVFEAGGTTVKDYSDQYSDADLDNELFETIAQDPAGVVYTIWDNYWADAVDMDGDGYTRYRKLYTDVDVNDGSTRSIYLKIWVKPASSGTYTLYFTTPNFSITGATGNDWIWVAVGSPNTQLNQDSYDFYVQVFEAGGTTVKDYSDQYSDADLDNELFEAIEGGGVVYTIWDNYWADAVDVDGDGYTRYRKLYTDVDVNDGSTRSIYLKIWRRPASSATYTLYFTTPNFSITGATGNDWIWVAVGSPNPELNHDTYYFTVQVFEAGGTTVKDEATKDTDADLDNELFETIAQDPTPVTLSIPFLTITGQMLLMWMVMAILGIVNFIPMLM